MSAPRTRATLLRRMGAALAVAAAVAAAAFALLYVARNRVDVRKQLNPAHPAYAALGAAARDGEGALREALAAYLLERPAPALPPLIHLRYAGDGPDLVRLTDALPAAVQDWQPGQPLPWSGGVSRTDLFDLQRQVFLFRIDWAAAPPESLEQALAFLAEWRRGNCDWPNRNPYAWNDDTMSNRLVAQISLMEHARARGLSSLEHERAFVASLVRQARHLVSEEEHNYRSNHGIMQNIALLVLSLHYPELDRDWAWRRLAVERMRRHLEETVTDEGVFRELTAQYHWFAVVNTMWFVGACRAAGIELDPVFERKLRGLMGFGREILLPDKTLPVIADTGHARTPRVFDWMWELVPAWPEAVELREALAATGPPNGPGAALWPEGGYFVLRAGTPEWSRTSGLMLTFKLHSDSRAHAHRDALSLTLYGGGRPLLEGPGYPDYEDTAERRLLVGTVSQNTVAVDGGSQRLGRAELTVRDIRLEGGVPRFAAVGGRIALYDGVSHERTVFFGMEDRALLVVDRLSADAEHRYALQFRPARELHAAIRPGWAVLATDHQVPALAIGARYVGPQGLASPETKLEGDMIRFVHAGKDAWLLSVLDIGGAGRDFPVAFEGRTLAWPGPLGHLVLEIDAAGNLAYDWTAVSAESRTAGADTAAIPSAARDR